LDSNKHRRREKQFFFMKAKRHVEVTVETNETTVIRFGGRRMIIFCESCQSHTQHLSVGQAVSFLSLSELAVRCLAGAKKTHSTRNVDGSLMLCANSLLAQAMDQ
jgi:hypothetical protein